MKYLFSSKKAGITHHHINHPSFRNGTQNIMYSFRFPQNENYVKQNFLSILELIKLMGHNDDQCSEHSVNVILTYLKNFKNIF